MTGRKWIRLGVLWGTIASLVQTEFGQLAFKYAHNTGNAWITANYLLVPLIAGIVGGFFWRRCHPTSTDLAGYSSQTAALLLLASFILNWIGFIPLFFAGFVAFTALVMFIFLLALTTGVVWLGGFIGSRLFGPSA